MSRAGDSASTSEPSPAAAFRFEDLPPLDALIKEYLLWRGFTQCFRTFEAARHNDRLQFFNVPVYEGTMSDALTGKVWGSHARSHASDGAPVSFLHLLNTTAQLCGRQGGH